MPIRDASGRAVRLVGCVSDVTEQRQMEQALRESEQRYAAAMQAINESVYEWNLETNEMYYSPRLYDTLQLTPAELRTREDWLNRIHPDDLPGFRAANIDHLKGITDRLQAEYRYRHADGTWHWARQHGVASRHANGRAHRMVGSTGDITLERRLAEELERARRRLNDALETIGEGFVLFDAEDRVVMCNSRYRSWFDGVADQVVPGNTFAAFVRAAVDIGLFPAAQSDPDGFMATLLARRRNPSGPREQYLSTGIWLQVSDYKMNDGMHVGVYTDITELKRQQKVAADARVQAEAALTRLQAAQQQLIIQGKMASLGQLTAGIAHEIKNPLNFVNNFAILSRELLDELRDILATLPTSAEATRHLAEIVDHLDGNLGRISQHGARADRIVKSMLKHSRTDEMQRAVTGVNQLVEESINLAYHSARVELRDFEVEISQALDASAGEIDCFPQDLSRALLNVIGNAFYAAHSHKHLQAGSTPKLAVTTTGSESEVRILVWDNGGGIPPELHEKVFTPFFTTKPPGEGTGLGLSLAYDIIVKQHGGAITFASVPDSFTEFELKIPRTAPQSRT
jgi:two-component system NtrC family sensor kinase